MLRSGKHFRRMSIEQEETPTQAQVVSLSEVLKFLSEERLKQDEEMAME